MILQERGEQNNPNIVDDPKDWAHPQMVVLFQKLIHIFTQLLSYVQMTSVF